LILQSKITRYLNNIDIIKNLDEKRFKQVNFNDMFEIVKPRKVFDINNSENGDIPLYDLGNKLNITKYINDYSYDNENIEILLLITFDGNCYEVKHKKFAIMGHGMTKLIKLKSNKNIDIEINTKLITLQLNKLYTWSNPLRTDLQFNNLNLYLYI